MEFSFGRNALYPDFVGDLITVEEYEALLPQLFALASHCGPGFQSWQGEAFDPPEAFTHGFRLDSAALQGEALILRGQLIQGAPGELEALADCAMPCGEASRGTASGGAATDRATPGGAGSGSSGGETQGEGTAAS